MTLTKRALLILIALLVVALAATWYYYTHQQPTSDIRVYYSRDIAANEQIAQIIREADEYAYFAVYTFTLTDLKDALLGAKYRGVKVAGLVDRDQWKGLKEQAAIVKELRDAGIPVAIDHHQGIMHLKVLVTEDAYVSGSYNWTNSATKVNDEVLEIGTNKIVHQQYYELMTRMLDKYPPEN